MTTATTRQDALCQDAKWHQRSEHGLHAGDADIIRHARLPWFPETSRLPIICAVRLQV